MCVYGLGDADAYGLNWPTASPTSNGWESGTYLAVSEEVLLGYGISNYVGVAGGRSHLNDSQRDTILRSLPVDRVGRTIRVYDLPGSLGEAISSETNDE